MSAQRLFDIVLALLLLPLALPLIAIIAATVCLRDGAPVFYGAERMRTPDQAFILWKFRTMARSDSDTGVSGGDKTARITRTGRVLRRTRLDEVPQIWNILRGDIGFVGPRPPLRQYVERFPQIYARVLRSRPGVTGLATLVFHRHESRLLAVATDPATTDAIYCRRCIPRKARLDLIWQAHRSLCFDARLILATAGVVIGRRVNVGRRRRSR
jgi:lipopolysaccharide/colanic/teichoic acid biosynthesis glycosyltransferase